MNQTSALLPDTFRPIRVPLVRLGSEYDGGYVVAQPGLDRCNHLLSFGINTDWTFERDFAGTKAKSDDYSGIDAYDPTLTTGLLCRSTFKHYGRKLLGNKVANIGTLFTYRSFFGQSKNQHHRYWIGASDRPATVDFNQCLARLPQDRKPYVKMDIEGSEYQVLDQISASHDRIPAMSIEYHDFDSAHRQFHKELNRLHHRFHVVHVHVNNYARIADSGCPTVIEVSYIHKSLVSDPAWSTQSLPIAGLDQPNKPTRPDPEIQFRASASNTTVLSPSD